MDIIGFDAQINAPKGVRSIIKKAMAVRPIAPKAAIKKTMAPRPVAPMAPRPVAPMAPRPVAPMAPRPIAPMAPRPIAPMTPRPVAPAAPKSVAPARVPMKMTAQTTSNVVPTSVQADKAPMAIVKSNGKSIPVSKLMQTTSPRVVENVSPIQRSYMPVDLPYERPTPKSKLIKVPDSPYSYSVDLDMIQPPVDSGTRNFYGK